MPFSDQTPGDALYLEEVPLARLAQVYGTPLFAYSEAALLSALREYQIGLQGRTALVCYAVKANPNLSLLQLLIGAGCGLGVVSAGELERALAAGCPAEQIVFVGGVGTARAGVRRAVDVGIGCFNVDCEAELACLNQVALQLGKRAPVSVRVRVNPAAAVCTESAVAAAAATGARSPYIEGVRRGNRVGVAQGNVLELYRYAARLPGVRIIGIGFHIGSQITEVAPYLAAIDEVLDLLEEVERDPGIHTFLGQINLGGGLGIDYYQMKEEQEEEEEEGEDASDVFDCYQGGGVSAYNGGLDPSISSPPNATDFCEQIFERLDARGYGDRRFILEPGRSLVGNAGVCLTEVLYLKPGETGNLAVVDVGTTELPGPALYGTFHQIVPVLPRESSGSRCTADDSESGGEMRYDIVGPGCEGGDWIGLDRTLNIKPGDVLAVLSAGAYCMSMASNYNTRGRPLELLVRRNECRIIRRRETVEDQLRCEVGPRTPMIIQ